MVRCRDVEYAVCRLVPDWVDLSEHTQHIFPIRESSLCYTVNTLALLWDCHKMYYKKLSEDYLLLICTHTPAFPEASCGAETAAYERKLKHFLFSLSINQRFACFYPQLPRPNVLFTEGFHSVKYLLCFWTITMLVIRGVLHCVCVSGVKGMRTDSSKYRSICM